MVSQEEKDKLILDPGKKPLDSFLSEIKQRDEALVIKTKMLDDQNDTILNLKKELREKVCDIFFFLSFCC